MKKIIALLLALLALIPGRAEETPLLYMINVGKGDAILLFHESDVYLVDAGKSGSWDITEAALKRMGIAHLKGVFLTHTDKDHAGGMKKLAKSDIKVDAWYASAYYNCESQKHPLVKALEKRGCDITFLKAGDRVDGVFDVLGPVYPDTRDEDDNSLVMRFTSAGVTVLLCGDMENGEERDLLGEDLTCDIFKVPNHADNDVLALIDPADLHASVALISTDPEDKPGTPDGLVMWRLEQAGMQIWSTHETELGIRVSVKDGEIRVTPE